MATDKLMLALGPGKRWKDPFRSKDLDKLGRATDPPEIQYIEIAYRGWDGTKGAHKDSMGKYGARVYPLDGGEPMPNCNEVEVAKLLRAKLGYEAFFLTTFSIPDHWRPWTIPERSAPEWLKAFDREVRERPFGPRGDGGMPDVVAWNPSSISPRNTALFVECKKPRENVGKDQEPWFAAALALGVSPEACAVAVRMTR